MPRVGNVTRLSAPAFQKFYDVFSPGRASSFTEETNPARCYAFATRVGGPEGADNQHKKGRLSRPFGSNGRGWISPWSRSVLPDKPEPYLCPCRHRRRR